MAKFHINHKGEAKECRAREGNCPITKQTGHPHYATLEDAEAAYEEMNNSLSLSTMSKKETNTSITIPQPTQQNLLIEEQGFKEMVQEYKKAEYKRSNTLDELEETSERIMEIEEIPLTKWEPEDFQKYRDLLTKRTNMSLHLLRSVKRLEKAAERIDENVDAEKDDAILFLQKTREEEITKIVKLRKEMRKMSKSPLTKMFKPNRREYIRHLEINIDNIGNRVRESLWHEALWEPYGQTKKSRREFFNKIEPLLEEYEMNIIKHYLRHWIQK